MGDYTISFARSARKELERLPNPEIQKIFTRIVALSIKPRPRGCIKLVGEDDLWRIRIGNYRILYKIDDQLLNVDIIAIRHRSEAYQ